MPRRMRDDLGREVFFGPKPSRVVSLVPSETYNLFALGLGAAVVGRTDYCVEPVESVSAIPSVGGTKDADFDRITQLEPDLILANQEENSRPVLEKLARERYRVFVSFPRTVVAAVAHLARLARIFGVEREPVAQAVVARGYALIQGPPPPPQARVFVPIWMDPLMTFGAGTYAHDVLAWAGLANVFEDRRRSYPLKADLGQAEPLPAERTAGRDTRYPRISLAELGQRAPDRLLLPDEPHACSEDDARTLIAAVSGLDPAAVHFVSGKDLFWPGAWTAGGIERLRRLLY